MAIKETKVPKSTISNLNITGPSAGTCKDGIIDGKTYHLSKQRELSIHSECTYTSNIH